LFFLTVRTTLGSLVWMSRARAWKGSTEPITQGSHLASSLNGARDSVTSSKVLEGARAVSSAVPLVGTLV
jgi:hypothetical protein